MRPLVIGVGNDIRGDDAAGRLVARLLRDRNISADVIESGGEGTSMMDCWNDRPVVLIIDAMMSGSAPGKVHRVDAERNFIPSNVVTRSSHSFGVREAIELSRSLGTLPSRVTLFLIEGESFETGAEMSASVRRSAEEVVERIIEIIEELKETKRPRSNQ